MNRVRAFITANRSWLPWAVGGVFLALAAVLPLLAIEIPGVFPGASYTPGTLQLLALCLLFASLALSYHLLFGTVGLLSFGHALYFAVGAYGLGIVLEQTDLELLPAIGLALAAAIVIASLLGAVSLRVTGISFAMVTLAFAQAGNVIVRRNPAITGGEEGIRLDIEHVPDFLVGVLNTRNLYWLTLVLLVVVYLAVLWFEKSRGGRVAAATRENELRVRVIGLRPIIIKLAAFVLASALAALVGMAYLLLQSGATPRATSADFTLTLLDQRLTSLAGSDAIAGLPDILRIPLSEPLFILGTLFILVVLFLPGGIAGIARTAVTGRGSLRKDRDELEEVS